MEQLVRLKPMMIGKALHQELVFKDDMGKQFSQDRLQKTFKRLREELGMSAQHVLYGLRHSFGTNLSNQDMNMEKVRVLMGHSKITTTQRYMKIKAADLGVELSKKSFTLRLA
jgi:site-specific recombinase XerD